MNIERTYLKLTVNAEDKELLLHPKKTPKLEVLMNTFEINLDEPYCLGSIAIDADMGSDVYKALCEKYGDTIATNQKLWVMHHERTESIEAEFGEI